MINNDFVVIKLDKNRKLRISYKAFKAYKAHFGKSITQINMDNFDLEDVARIIFVGLIHEDPEITFEYVEELIDKASLQYCIEKMKEAINASLGNAQGTAKIQEK